MCIRDRQEIVEAIEIYLKNEGYEIFKAYDGQEALEVLDLSLIHILNLSGCYQLSWLYSRHNLLEQLDLSDNTALEFIETFDNKLTSIAVSYTHLDVYKRQGTFSSMSTRSRGRISRPQVPVSRDRPVVRKRRSVSKVMRKASSSFPWKESRS